MTSGRAVARPYGNRSVVGTPNGASHMQHVKRWMSHFVRPTFKTSGCNSLQKPVNGLTKASTARLRAYKFNASLRF
jgi:hypothetical protein